MVSKRKLGENYLIVIFSEVFNFMTLFIIRKINSLKQEVKKERIPFLFLFLSFYKKFLIFLNNSYF